MKNWIWPCMPKNWDDVKKKLVWGASPKGRGSKITKKDRIIFYVSGRNHFHAIFEVISDWHESTITWTDGSKSAEEIDLKVIQYGYANVDEVNKKTKFWSTDAPYAKGLFLRGHANYGVANSGKPISDEDYTTIFEDLKKSVSWAKKDPNALNVQ